MKKAEPWRVTLINTGDHTQTGGRLLKTADYIRDEQAFCFTYGDGLGDIDITASIEFTAPMAKRRPLLLWCLPGDSAHWSRPARLSARFSEKPPGDGNLINGGFFVLSPQCLELIEGDSSSWEGYPMKTLAEQGNLMAFEHRGFWQPMDTLREKYQLQALWDRGRAPWKLWS